MVYANLMKSISMKILVLLAVLAGGVIAARASDLSDCVGDCGVSWNSCFGTTTFAEYLDRIAGYVAEELNF